MAQNLICIEGRPETDPAEIVDVADAAARNE